MKNSMTQKLKSIPNKNSKKYAHFTTFCIKELQKIKDIKDSVILFSFTYCIDEETRSQETKQLLLSHMNNGLS